MLGSPGCVAGEHTYWYCGHTQTPGNWACLILWGLHLGRESPPGWWQSVPQAGGLEPWEATPALPLRLGESGHGPRALGWKVPPPLGLPRAPRRGRAGGSEPHGIIHSPTPAP